MSKPKNKTEKTESAKYDALRELLKAEGTKIYTELEKGQFPQFYVPSRSVSNIVYDKKLRQYILGKAAGLRSSRNMSQLRSFTQLIWLAFFANRLVQEKKIVNLERYLLLLTSI